MLYPPPRCRTHEAWVSDASLRSRRAADIASGQFDKAKDLGWDGVDPPPPSDEQLAANKAAMADEEETIVTI